MRRTNLTFEDLMEEFNNSMPYFRKCFLINEIGGIFEDKEEKALEAESFLRELLSSDNAQYRFLAYCYLSAVDNKSVETPSALKEFENNPQNTETIAMAQAAIKSRKATNN